MISLTSQYAIRAVMYIARSERWCTADDIATAAMTPRGYISKVLQTLTGSQIISSQRGLNGGFHLVGDAHSITAFDVIHAIDAEDRLGVCRDSRENASFFEGSAGKLFSDIKSDIVRRLQETAISDLISQDQELASSRSAG